MMAAENGQAEVCLSLGEIGADANVTDKVSECQIWYLCVCVCVCVCMYVCVCPGENETYPSVFCLAL